MVTNDHPFMERGETEAYLGGAENKKNIAVCKKPSWFRRGFQLYLVDSIHDWN